MHPQFAVHMLNEEGKKKAQEIAQGFDDLLTRLESICPDGRSLDIVKAKLEEACFFAKKAMAEQNTDQPRETLYVKTDGGISGLASRHGIDLVVVPEKSEDGT
jgi:hypothetical protein